MRMPKDNQKQELFKMKLRKKLGELNVEEKKTKEKWMKTNNQKR